MAFNSYRWNEYIELCNILAFKFKKSDLINYEIVAISRGGLIPATILSHYLDIPKVTVIGVKSYINKEQDELVIYQSPYYKNEVPSKILLVDDLIDTGNTLRVVIDHLNCNNNKPEIKVAVLIDKANTPNIICVDKIKNDIWVEFPYE